MALQGLARGDKNAVEAIYRQHYKMIYTLVVNNNGSADDAKDIFQEGVIVLYEKARQPEFNLNCQLKTYLYSVCRRLWLKRLQLANRILTITDPVTEVISVDEDMEVHEQKNQELLNLESSINSLGEPCKSILEAYYLEKKNMLEIAAQFGYTNAENAKNQKYKCLSRLKKIYFAQINKEYRDA